MTTGAAILWRRLDRPGHEAARLIRADDHWQLSGTAVFLHERQPVALEYAIVCDALWRTRSAKVNGWIGQQQVAVVIDVGADGAWRLNGGHRAAVAACVDVDLNFSPSTNLLPIRRLGLSVGEDAMVTAAWLRFPSMKLEPLEQLYRRIGERTYHYESSGGTFKADLEVDENGFVENYAGIWRAER